MDILALDFAIVGFMYLLEQVQMNGLDVDPLASHCGTYFSTIGLRIVEDFCLRLRPLNSINSMDMQKERNEVEKSKKAR